MSTLSQTTHTLERAWSAIRAIYPETPAAVIVVYRHPRQDRRGHWWPAQWHTKNTNGTTYTELHISSTILNETADHVLTTLLHEACHGIADTRGIQDTSRQGRYHNANFVEIATELGLLTEKNSTIGSTTPGITDKTKTRFKNTLDDLTESLDLYQEWLTGTNIVPGKGKTKNRNLKMTCPACNRIIRASQQTIDAGPITCWPCSSPDQRIDFQH
jgi:SprT-like family.